MTTIYTSSWFTKLPVTVQKIGISRGTPRGYEAGYRKMMALAPGSWFNSVSVRDYKRLYFEQLAALDPAETVRRILELADGRDCALLCYEAPHKLDEWCHRGMVSAWLHDALGLEVFEWGMEAHGCGWHHPKLPQCYRAHRDQPEPLDVAPYIGAEAESAGAVWKVVGFDPENPDQAVIESGRNRKSISGEVLRRHFRPLL